MRQLVQRDIPYSRNGMEVDPILVVQLGGVPQGRLGVVLIPEVKPVPEPHFRPDLHRPGTTLLLFQLFQLLGALFLGLSQHILCLGIAAVVVSNNHPALPASVLPQADGALTFLPLLRHTLTPSP